VGAKARELAAERAANVGAYCRVPCFLSQSPSRLAGKRCTQLRIQVGFLSGRNRTSDIHLTCKAHQILAQPSHTRLQTRMTYDPSPAWQMQNLPPNVKKAITYQNQRRFFFDLGGGELTGPNVERFQNCRGAPGGAIGRATASNYAARHRRACQVDLKKQRSSRPRHRTRSGHGPSRAGVDKPGRAVSRPGLFASLFCRMLDERRFRKARI
jgi:hypothetical protein